ncbi:hypothetical protein [Alloyangia pacifica]|uniref:DUF2946 domain-containing protein n=1 Tax=Alloyangia pacifica TaxID=311180 RepID=A0A1I6UNM4_9RHOB|nr:hypothetical protein [Alloyangia pacifica]SDH76535.1 hypothetical protein SAMN04488245_109210 [Alloyangia pacifica]SFT03013.1 hypothetical protein SAMN04488050_108210 [Alloyangia pacifica]
MSIRRALPAFACVLAVFLAVTGVTSAGLMAPDRAVAARLATERAFGLAPGDLCAPQRDASGHRGHGEHSDLAAPADHDSHGEHAAHDHPCPFCHGLPGAPRLAHDGHSTLLIPHDGWRQSADRHRAAQSRDADHSPRAPPALA